MDSIRHLLRGIFNHDFTHFTAPGDFERLFFERRLALADLKEVYEKVAASQYEATEKSIPSALLIPGQEHAAPLMILAQLHGNEPAGLAGILLAMALSSAGKLKRDVVGVVGNPLAASQYFAALEEHATARQETRDAYRCGLAEDGSLLADMNRIPVDFMMRVANNHHIKRAQELFAIAQSASGILDIHSARGHMVCITDHKRDQDLRHSPIRSILTELAEAISAHSSGQTTVRTFKGITESLPNIISQTGIEAGKHESAEAPHIAASFTLSLLHALGMADAQPLREKEDGTFMGYAVRPRIAYADLICEGTIQKDDKIYMARTAQPGEKPLIEGYVAHQYEEMEAIAKGQVVAVAVPSGAVFKAPRDFSGIFFSKSATLYDRDPNVGPWPVAADKLGTTKFCYPCDVSSISLPP